MEITVSLGAQSRDRLPEQSQALHPDLNFYIFLCFGSKIEGGGRIEEEDLVVDPRFRVLADFDVPTRGWAKGA
jgi:hypothetical protein